MTQNITAFPFTLSFGERESVRTTCQKLIARLKLNRSWAIGDIEKPKSKRALFYQDEDGTYSATVKLGTKFLYILPGMTKEQPYAKGLTREQVAQTYDWVIGQAE